MTHNKETAGKSDTSKPAPAPKRNTTTTRELMGNARELVILHAEDQYLLRITSNGKLILTK